MHAICRLDVGEYVAKESKQKDTLYELYAVINHYGELEFGHCKL